MSKMSKKDFEDLCREFIFMGGGGSVGKNDESWNRNRYGRNGGIEKRT